MWNIILKVLRFFYIDRFIPHYIYFYITSHVSHIDQVRNSIRQWFSQVYFLGRVRTELVTAACGTRRQWRHSRGGSRDLRRHPLSGPSVVHSVLAGLERLSSLLWLRRLPFHPSRQRGRLGHGLPGPRSPLVLLRRGHGSQWNQRGPALPNETRDHYRQGSWEYHRALRVK